MISFSESQKWVWKGRVSAGVGVREKKGEEYGSEGFSWLTFAPSWTELLYTHFFLIYSSCHPFWPDSSFLCLSQYGTITH